MTPRYRRLLGLKFTLRCTVHSASQGHNYGMREKAYLLITLTLSLDHQTAHSTAASASWTPRHFALFAPFWASLRNLRRAELDELGTNHLLIQRRCINHTIMCQHNRQQRYTPPHSSCQLVQTSATPAAPAWQHSNRCLLVLLTWRQAWAKFLTKLRLCFGEIGLRA